MKMIVSDYDGTLKRFIHNPNIIEKIDLNKDLKYIKKFIEDGNIFTISSKRNLTSIKEQIEKYNVPYNYITASNGLITLDKNDNLIYAEYLNKEMLKAIEELSKSTNLLQCVTGINEYGNKEKELKDTLISIRMSVKNIRNTMDYFRSLNIDLSKYNFSYDKKGFWINNNTNKQLGIERLLNKTETTPDMITSVGNSYNDIEMIKENNGYCINGSEVDKYGDINIKRTPNIRTLIKTIK